MKIELLAIDMDGTLLYPDDTIAPQATEIIDKIAKKSVKIAIIGVDKLKSFEKNGIRPERDGYPHARLAEGNRLYLLQGGKYLLIEAWNKEVQYRQEHYLPCYQSWIRECKRLDKLKINYRHYKVYFHFLTFCPLFVQT